MGLNVSQSGSPQWHMLFFWDYDPDKTQKDDHYQNQLLSGWLHAGPKKWRLNGSLILERNWIHSKVT